MLLLLLSHSPPAITHPQSPLSSLSGRSSPRFLLLTRPLRGSAFLHPCLDQPCCLELSLTSRPLHTGSRVLLLQVKRVSGWPLTSTFRLLIGFPFSSVNSKHLSWKQGPPGPGYCCLSHLSSPTLFFPAGFAKQTAVFQKTAFFPTKF